MNATGLRDGFLRLALIRSLRERTGRSRHAAAEAVDALIDGVSLRLPDDPALARELHAAGALFDRPVGELTAPSPLSRAA